MKRYPGIRPFTSDDQHLFKGRDEEKRDLFELIVLNDIVVLFGKSGIGKSSLLNAGVCPQLEDRNLHPVFIRLNNTNLPPEEQVFELLHEKKYIPAHLPKGLTMWEYFKQFWHVDLGEVFTPVIVLDQFEELFTLYAPEQRQDFIDQLADIVNGHVPEIVREKIKSGSTDLDDSIDLETPPKVKFVLSIRSDYLYLLDELSADIPAILRTRFQLQMLKKDNAIQAITLPAAMAGDFESLNFNYSEEARSEIIAELGKKETDQLRSNLPESAPEIEAFQLQLLCQYLENKIIENQEAVNFTITPDFYGGKEGIKTIIKEFYSGVIDRVPKDYQDAVEILMAKNLIRNKRRIIMEESAIIADADIPKTLLDQLHKERMLRREARTGNFYYEISHDTLIEPVLEKYKFIEERLEKERLEQERIAKENELAAAKKQAEEEKHRAEKQSQLRAAAEQNELRARQRTRLAMGISLLALLLAGAAFLFWKNANEESKRARSNELAMQAIVNTEKNPTMAISSAMKAIELQDGILQQSALYQLILPKNNGIEYPFYEELTIPKKARGVLSSPDEQNILFTEDSLAYLYHVDTKTRIGTIPKKGKLTASINASSFSGNGEQVSLALDDGTLLLYNIPTKGISIRKIHQNSIGTLQFTNDQKWVLSASEDGKVMLTAVDSTVASITVYESDRPIKSAMLTSDESYISIVFDGKTDVIALAWDNQTHRATDILEMTHFDGTVGFQIPHPFENKMIYPKGTGIAVLWNLETNETIVLKHQTDRSVQQAQFTKDGNTILTASREGIVYIWTINGDLISQTESLSGVAEDAYFTNHNLDIIARYKNGLKLWDGESGQLKSNLNGFRFSVNDFTYLPTKDILISTSQEEAPKQWQLYTKKIAEEYLINAPSIGLKNAISGDLFAYTQADYSIAIWDFQQKKYWETPSISYGVSTLKFYKNKLLIAAEDGQLLAYDLITKELNTIIETEGAVIIQIEISKDSQYLLIQTEEQTRVCKIDEDSLSNIQLQSLPDNFTDAQLIRSAHHVLGFDMETSKITIFDLESNSIEVVSDSLPLSKNEFTLKVNDSEIAGFIRTFYSEAFLVDWKKSMTYSFEESIGNGLFYQQNDLITWHMGNVKFWDISGKPVSWHAENIFPSGENVIENIQLSPDQQFIFFRSNDNIIKIYNLKKGTKQPLNLVYEVTLPSLDDFYVTSKGDQLVFQLDDRIIIYPFSQLKIKQSIQ